MSASAQGPRVAAWNELPDWLRPLAGAAQHVQPEQLTRHAPPDPGTGRASAVLMAFAELAGSTASSGGPGVLLIERAGGMRTHAGQIAFPGGASDPGDADAAATAVREAEEEVGLTPSSVAVIATLPTLFLPPSGFVVSPVLAWWSAPHPVGVVDAREVADVALVPVADLAEPANRFRVPHPSGYVGPGFAVNGWFVWGFTAGLLDNLLTLGGWARPWDETVLRPVPGTVKST